MVLRKAAAFAVAAALTAVGAGASAQVSDDVVRVAILTDMTGPYSGWAGSGSVLAAQMAAEDFGGTVLGKKIEIVSADHQNKADVGANLARQWFDVGGVDMLIDVPNSAVALAVQEIAKQKNRVFINTGASTTELTGAQCSPVGIHWVSDAYALSHGTARSVVKGGGTSWFFLTVDYAGGYILESNATAAVEASGGKVVGKVRHPLNTADFSSFLLQAQASGAKVVGLANAGADTINAVKQAGEFGLQAAGQSLVGMFVNINDIKALGLPVSAGTLVTEAYYWDMNDETRAFAKRFQERHNAPPSQYQAGDYSAISHYLKAVKAAGTDEAKAVVAKMRELPVDDFFAKGGKVREDGRMVHDMYLMQVKKPEESRGEWDLYKTVQTIPAAEAFRPLAETACPLVKK
jgi:branched-chain amino acid transport system substrate-binding protein